MLNAVKDIHKRRADNHLGGHEFFHFKGLPAADFKVIRVGIENGTIFALIALAVSQGQRRKSLFELEVLQIANKAGYGAELLRHAGKRPQGITDNALYLRGNFHALLPQEVTEPFLRPLALVIIVNMGKRLEGQFSAFAAKVIELASHARSQHLGGRTLIEDNDLRILVFAERCFKAVKEHGFTCTSRPDHKAMANIPHMQVQPEGRIACCLGVDKRRAI